MAEPNDLKIFLLVSSDKNKLTEIEAVILKHFPGSTIYTAKDGGAGLLKMKNVVPHVIVCDFQDIKMAGSRFIDTILHHREWKSVAIVVADYPPEKEIYLNEVVTNRIQFITNEDIPFNEKITPCLYKALNYAFNGDKAEFRLRFLVPSEILIQEGEAAEFVYLVKSGKLMAYRTIEQKQVVLGPIEAGEFVGEMAFVSGESRSASVRAETECELIEVPVGTFEKVLYMRPSWSKRMMANLSKRLKQANEALKLGDS